MVCMLIHFLILSFRRVLYLVCFLLGNFQRLSSKSQRFGTLYQFQLQGLVDEEWLGLRYVVYLYQKWSWQGSDRANKEDSDRTGRVDAQQVLEVGGGLNKYFAGGINVSFSWVYAVVVCRICWGWILNLCWRYLDASQFRWLLWWDDPCSRFS